MSNDKMSDNQGIQLIDIREISHFSWSDPNGIAVIMPCTDAALGMKTARVLSMRAGMPCIILVVKDTKRQGFVRTLNETAARVTVKYIVYLAQDAWPGRGWLQCAFKTMESSGMGLLAFNDGKWKGRIASFGMVRTSWVLPIYGGDIFFSGYRSHAADNELTVIARALDMHIYNPECTLMEYDPDKDFGGSNPSDRALFYERFTLGFEGLVPFNKLGALAREYKAKWGPSQIARGVSVIILSRNGGWFLERLLDGFFAKNTHAPTEVIIVDHGSSDTMADVVARYAPRGFIRLINRGKKKAFTDSVRIGVERSRYPWLIFLKNNTIYTSDVVPHALARLKDATGRVAGVRLNDDLENLTIESNAAALDGSAFQLLACHKGVFDSLENADKIFRIADKYTSGKAAPVKPEHQLPLAGFSPDSNEPDGVNIVVYTTGELTVLRRCLTSLQRCTDLRQNILFVIDDSQNPYVKKKISEWLSGIDFVARVTHRERKGFCNALRDLVSEVKWGDFCVIADPAAPTPGWLDGLKKAAYADRRIALVSPVTPTHPLYAFRMNPGDNINTCTQKLSMVSARDYPIIPEPDMAVFYLKQATCRHHPLPPFSHDSARSYFRAYTAKLSEIGSYCTVADDTFVYVSPYAFSPLTTNRDQDQRDFRRDSTMHELKSHDSKNFKIISLENYVASDIRLDSSRTLVVFFSGLSLNGGALVLVEFCNDLILKGWNVVPILMNRHEKEDRFFDLLFEPYPCTDAHEISARLSNNVFLMATFWTTAQLVNQTAGLNSAFIPFYFIQDFEVMFYNSPEKTDDPKQKKYYAGSSESYRLNLHHLTTSEWIAGKVRSFLNKPDHLIQKLRIGFNPELFYPPSNGRSDAQSIRIIAMARPKTPRRGFTDLIRALTIVYETNPDIEIFLYGTEDLSAFTIPFPFHNLGVVRPMDLRKHYARADIYIDASLFQGYGLTGLEAMACGCACILTDSGGSAEYAQNEHNVLIVPSGDPGAQAHAVLRLLDDAALRQKLAANARTTSKNFSIHHAAEDFEKIAGQLTAARDAAISRMSADRTCNIIIPIFNEISTVRKCLESIESNTGHLYRVFLVDDCSDHHTAEVLRQFAAERENYTYLRNEKNLGFVGSINAGMQAAETGDMVLLNSDTIVTPGWLAGLVRCAGSDPDIGIISPLSTRSSHLWIIPNPGETIFETAKSIRETAIPRYPDIVTPEGWCFYIRRRVYETLGGFDPVYGRGYCEESDYSMRAMANGWRTVCCDDTFIFHEGMVTFKEQRGERYRHNRKIFDGRWAHYYQKQYQTFLTRNPLGHLRHRHRALMPAAWNDPVTVPQKKKNILDRLADVVPPEVIRRYRRQLEDPAFNARIWQKTRGNPRTIVFLVQEMPFCKGILSVIRLANDMIFMGLDVKVLVPSTGKNPEFPGLLTRPVYLENETSLIKNFPSADIVVATSWITVYYMTAVFADNPDFMPLYFVQDFEPDNCPDREPKIRKHMEAAYRLPPYVFAATPWICERAEAIGARITRVPPALDLDVFYPRDIADAGSGLKMVLTRLDSRLQRRDVEIAAGVLKRLQKARKDIAIHVFGCDDEALRKHGLLVPVINHGRVNESDLPEMYSRAHVFVEFSSAGGISEATIAEAMACGCACVVTDSGGGVFARPEETALTAPPRDIQGFFTQINKLCDDDDLRRCLGARARQGILQFDHRHSVQKILSFFMRCLGEGESRGDAIAG